MARPNPEIPLSKTELFAFIFGVLAFVFIGVLLFTSYAGLPERVATHFGFNGEPDGWGAKSSLLWMLLMSALLFIGLCVLSRFPRLFNYPCEVTEQNAERLYLCGRKYMVLLAAEMAWMFALLFFGSIRAAQGHTGLLLPLTLGWMLIIMVSSVLMVVRMRKAGEEEE